MSGCQHHWAHVGYAFYAARAECLNCGAIAPVGAPYLNADRVSSKPDPKAVIVSWDFVKAMRGGRNEPETKS